MYASSLQRTFATFLLLLLGSIAPLVALDWPDVPASIREAVEMEFPGIAIDEVEYDDRGGSPVYAVKGEANGAEIELEITVDGVIVRAQADGIQLVGFEDDLDHDGMRDDDESAFGCDPNDPDSDNDAYPDGFEHSLGSDPLDHDDHPQIVSIRTECVEGGIFCLVLSVETFATGTFQLEYCDETGGWTPLGEPFAGDGRTASFDFPLEQGSKAGLFRVSLQADPEETTTGGTGSTGTVPCASPDSLRGMTFIIGDDDGETKTYVMGTSSRGELTEEEDGEVEFYPFDYSYQKTGTCSGTIRITFPSDDEETKGVIIKLTYTAQGIGQVVVQRFEGNHFEDPEAGTFQVSP